MNATEKIKMLRELLAQSHAWHKDHIGFGVYERSELHQKVEQALAATEQPEAQEMVIADEDIMQSKFSEWINSQDNPIRKMKDNDHPLPITYYAGYQAAIATLQQKHAHELKMRSDLCDAISGIDEGIKQEQAGMARDAGRYQFLAGADIPAHSTRWSRWKVEYWEGFHGGWQPKIGTELDEAIDAAISEQKGTQ